MNTELVADLGHFEQASVWPRGAVAAAGEHPGLEYLLVGMLDATRQLLAVDRAAVYYRDETGHHVCPVSFGLSDSYTGAVCRQLDAASTEGVRGPLDDVVTARNHPEDAEEIGETACTPLFVVPLRQGSDLAGAVVVYNENHGLRPNAAHRRAQALIERVAEAVDSGRRCDDSRNLAEEIEVLYDAIGHTNRSLGLVHQEPAGSRSRTARQAEPTGHHAAIAERRTEEQAACVSADPCRAIEEVVVTTNADSERVEETLRLLARVSDVLDTSPDIETVLGWVARLLVPALADWCLVDLVGPERARYTLGLAHRDPDGEQRLRELLDAYPAARTPLSNQKVLATGHTQLCAEISDAVLAGAAADPTQLVMLRQVGLTSLVIVPLRRRGEVFGTITLASASRGRVFGSVDLALAEEIADRIVRAFELNQVRQEAEEAVQVRNRFLAIVSHDLRSPLATIKTYAQVLERYVSKLQCFRPEQILAGLATISGTATKMAGQIDELLDVARLHAGEPLVLDRHPTDLVALARQVVDAQAQEAPRHSLHVQNFEPAIVGQWDRDRLERVLGNLVANAIKYSPGGGAVTVTMSHQKDDRGEWARLDVQDRGLGIPAADLPLVFQRFHRGRNVVGRIPGTGIGLTSARQIVEQHGGTIEISSREGQGTTVTIRLPLALM